MEANSVANNGGNSPNKTKAQIAPGVPYPVDTIENVIQVAKQLIEEHGTGRPISKEEIAKAVNRSPSGLSLYFSTLAHYGIFSTVHGKGYAPTELFRKYLNPIHDGDERKYMLEMFKKPSLYAKIIENQNGHVLPPDSRKLGNLLKEEPFNVTDYAAEKAAKVFLDNVKTLGLVDSHNTFGIDNKQSKPDPSKNVGADKPPHQEQPPKRDENLFELPIPISNGRQAKFSYPLENLTMKDIRVMAKALAFIATTVLSEDDAKKAEEDIEDEIFNDES